jgi:hypothetical protein
MKFLNKSEIEKALHAKIRTIVNAKVLEFQPKLQAIAKESVQDLEAVDTGLLELRTSVKIVSSSKYISIKYNTNNVEYAQFVYFGLGTNIKYGARKFNLVSVRKAKQLFEKGGYIRVFALGGANNTGTLEQGKKKNILQRRKRLFINEFKIAPKKAKKLGVYKQLIDYSKARKKAKKNKV